LHLKKNFDEGIIFQLTIMKFPTVFVSITSTSFTSSTGNGEILALLKIFSNAKSENLTVGIAKKSPKIFKVLFV